MSIDTAVLACAMLMAFGTMGSERAGPLPEVASPPLGETQWVAEHMSFNGLPMSLRTFASALSIDELFHYYESWGRTHRMKDAKRVRRGEWEVLAMKSLRHFVSIQARQTIGGSEGTIAVSPLLQGVHSKTLTQFPHPSSAKVVSLQQYQDSGVASEHISMVSMRSVAVEARAFSEMLSRHGWQRVRDETASAASRGHVLEAQRGEEHAVVTLQPDRTEQAMTAIVIVWRKP